MSIAQDYIWARESADLREGVYPVVKDAQGQPVVPVFRDEHGNILTNRQGTPGRPYCKPMTPRGEASAVISSADRFNVRTLFNREPEP